MASKTNGGGNGNGTMQTTFCFTTTLIAQGDGSYLLKPGKPLSRLSLREAAKRTGLSRTTIYRLWDCGLVKGERPSPRKIYIFVDSLEEHLKRTQDSEYWGEAERKRFAKAEMVKR